MHARPPLVILIPAAGAAQRMGARDKCLEEVDGEPALHRTARMALATGAVVLVTLPADGPRLTGRRASLAGLAVEQITIPDTAEGMAASLRIGAQWARERNAAAVMILLPDMPEITLEDIVTLLACQARAPERALRAASADGRPGHPVILPASLLPALGALSGDRGARDILKGNPPTLCPLPGARAILDLDTPREWDEWRAGRAQGDARR